MLTRHRRGGHCPLTSTRTFNRLHRFFLPPWWNRLAVKPHLFLDLAPLEYALIIAPGTAGSSAMKKRSFRTSTFKIDISCLDVTFSWCLHMALVQLKASRVEISGIEMLVKTDPASPASHWHVEMRLAYT